MWRATANSCPCDNVGRDADGALGDDGGAVVVVGMKMDHRSKEMLTWTLVKVARSGDQVIALHVMDPKADKPSLLGLAMSFDSVLAAYEGFCSLKQVDLKLKICKGSPARKILVREAKDCGTTTLIVGTSPVHHKIRSRTSVAEYCAKSLPENISIICVDNGKVVFHRGLNIQNASVSRRNIDLSGAGPRISTRISVPKSSLSLLPQKLLSLPSSKSENVTMALVPFTSQKDSQVKSRWALLRRLFLGAQKLIGTSGRKSLTTRWITVLPSQPYATAIYPVLKQITASDKDECHPNLKSETEAITPYSAEINLTPFSCNILLDELNAIRVKFKTICQWFSYQELLLATNNFVSDNLIGKGGSSLVYRGCLPGGNVLAVKILKPSKDVLKQFVSEVEIITSLHHKNIISLVGLCFEKDKLLLVYNLLCKGSMEENLHGTNKDTSLFGWDDRYKVAVGVAEALDYLHNSAKPIIHRDVKSSNILLSDNFEPQLSDFGLATWASTSSHHADGLDVAGTFGYLAPEYFVHGRVNEKIDVYAFGVVLLELLSGRKPIDYKSPKGHENLVMWAKHVLQEGKISELRDPKLVDCNFDQFEIMTLAATLCIRSAPQTRPEISTVLKLLLCDSEVVKWARQESKSVEESSHGTDHEPIPNIQSFLDLALLNMEEEEDNGSSCSAEEQTISVEDYLGVRRRC